MLVWLIVRVRRQSVKAQYCRPAQHLDPAVLPESLMTLLRPLLPVAYGPARVDRSNVREAGHYIRFLQTHPDLPVVRAMGCDIFAQRNVCRIRCSADLCSRLVDGRMLVSSHSPDTLGVEGLVSQVIDTTEPAAALRQHLWKLEALGGGAAPDDADFQALRERGLAAELAAGHLVIDGES
jgi:hypothetical protein